MEEKRTNLKRIKGIINMPNSITIGDPSYFDDEHAIKYTYNKRFRGKSQWICFLELLEDNVVYPPDKYCNEEMEIEDRYIKVYLAYDEKMLNLLKEGKQYSRQKIKTTEIGVDTAEYILDINGNGDNVKTGGDGCWGSVDEYYTGTKLEAITIELGLPSDYGKSFEEHKTFIESIFQCKLS